MKRYVSSKLILILAFLSGCSLKQESIQNVTIVLPPASATSSGTSLAGGYLSHGGSSSLSGRRQPQAAGDFDCYAINVTGPGIDDHFADHSCAYTGPMGSIFGFFPRAAAGQEISLPVPEGTNRRFQIYGVQKADGHPDCPNMLDYLANRATFDFLDQPIYLGEALSDVGDDTQVVIPAAYDRVHPRPIFCDQPYPVDANTGIVPSTQALLLGNALTVYVTIKDQNAQPISALLPTVALEKIDGTAATSGSCGVTDSNGMATCTITPQVDGEYNLALVSPFQKYSSKIHVTTIPSDPSFYLTATPNNPTVSVYLNSGNSYTNSFFAKFAAISGSRPTQIELVMSGTDSTCNLIGTNTSWTEDLQSDGTTGPAQYIPHVVGSPTPGTCHVPQVRLHYVDGTTLDFNLGTAFSITIQ